MTRAEIVAFNAGVAMVTSLAAQAAAAMRERKTIAPTRFPFATEALQAIADEAAGFVLPLPPGDGTRGTVVPPAC